MANSLEAIRHSASHVLATAVLRLFKEAKLDIGPATTTGFYYDIDLEHKFTAEDLAKIEDEMRKIIAEDQKFVRTEVSREEATKLIEKIGQQEFKLERLADIEEGEKISFYQNGTFLDLCAGPHVASTKEIGVVKLLSVAGAYHKGDEHNKQLQRIYGTAFPTQAELDKYLSDLEEAKKRDHRKIGKEMHLFVIDDDVGQGLVLWAPRGATVRGELEGFIKAELKKGGYDMVYTPHIGKLKLFKTSGHFPYYKDAQFPAILDREQVDKVVDAGLSFAETTRRMEGVSQSFANTLNERTGMEMITPDRVIPDSELLDGFLLKPMNCPFHIKIYDSEPRSYRDLPLRLGEFGSVYRWEQSGELNGLTRVRGFTQDDAHIFCTESQLSDEIQGCLGLVKIVLGTLGMTHYRVRLGLRDPDSHKYTGKSADWDKAEAACRDAVKTLGVPYTEEAGEAAFYGPKIDFVVKDVIGREWQLGTIQIDYNLPARFGISYTGSDNQKHTPVMIHRAPFGSFERFCGIVIEHFGGNFPLWLAPEQVRLITITDDQRAYADELYAKLKAAGIRASVDDGSDKLGAKIRKAETDRVPYMWVLGKKEAAEGKVAVRCRITKSDDGQTLPSADATLMLKKAIAEKVLPDANKQ